MPSQYWIISLPITGSREKTWAQVDSSLQKVSSDTQYYKLHVPELRVGTLDSLLALSDDLVKAAGYVEGVTHKIRRQMEELERALPPGTTAGPSHQLTVEGVPLETYITRFNWDEAKYPVMSPLRETVDTIHDTVSKLEDDLKIRSSEYASVKGQLSAINRKAGGSLLVRDLSTLVKESDIVSSEHMITLLVVVSKFAEKDWIKSYETLSNFVVPRSSSKIVEDNEYALFTVVIFRRVVDQFKSAAREKGFQVRDYSHDPEAAQTRADEQKQLATDQGAMHQSLLQWCRVGYGEVFSAWMHLSVIRLFAESILRYGLPPDFVGFLLVPSSRTDKKLRTTLETLSHSGDSSYWKGQDSEAGMIGLTGGETETHPYVSITLNLG